MKEKQWDPARNNEQSPAPGMAAVNTHNPEEETPIEEIYNPENARQEESRQNEGAIPEHQGGLRDKRGEGGKED
ncbi:hypothetical protein [Flavisolibacter tropicus]|uniref:Uncharacterized protein n=1 Tax=Flavisolibacter tropicus TaxID=1492898 RepID=A0A172TYC5_9BACT|nr:hypothetical protein [Flavisolibacter tropicus]ANE51737.1 hypothetical protein SY85_15780 [Flavisolibacter tropicus]